MRFSSVAPDTRDDFLITTIEQNRYSQKIKSKDLLKLLAKHGYKHYTANSNYINFVLKSPVDTSLIEEKVRNYYKTNYEDISINSIIVAPRGYLESLPDKYSIEIKNRDFLSSEGIVSVKTTENKKFFFNYTVVADVAIYKSRDVIKKDTQLTLTNCIKKSVALESFQDKPVQNIGQKQLQAKRHIPKDMILTLRDVEILDVVTKDSMINVNFFQDGMAITFSAKALQDGKVNDIIDVQNNSGKILKVRVTGSDMAEME
ncbi:MAG: flagellar basal body P-ring formation chaperone FlgA [Sulfurimonas sp.]|uniref:flagellar basal body P-ring formation chaperone FlgA n=1 Tax=Sulfurimonas sp. TaxID=2022749 RepID=UPI002617A5AF|nr:flagellar basal body P-ring formation chaperone FlgA [Sulfurimonas sp.]MDD2653309.1 flagellar basal body P-ring formation chaperone FlgA [Sulfurimonas sp.]MDD3450714.1 flagellar basal body P-ring formation chaperone FlgA [Sulfurimonas sp.]